MKLKYTIIFTAIIFSSNTNAQATEQDKLLHFGAGVGISAVTYAIVHSTTKNKKKALLWSFITSTSAGIIKELVDSGEVGNKFDGVDALATTAGGVVGGFTMHFILNDKKQATLTIDEVALQQELFFAIDAAYQP
jgi:uncharacterized protein YfiM (DUF2279 family)